MYDLKMQFKVLCIFLCGILVMLTHDCRAKPTLTFTLPPSLTSSLPSFSSYTRNFVEARHADQMKSYSGVRLANDTLIMIYYHDQSVAIVELGPAKLLVGCELIEIYNDNEGKKLLGKLSSINRPLEISFKEMVQLMSQCEVIDKQTMSHSDRDVGHSTDAASTGGGGGGGGIFPQSPLSLFSGIIPGTKWCGTGDIASTYNDLGTETTMDRCCRTHDLCPVKIRAYQRRYKLHNNSLYTKSHCVCDDMLYSCLKKTNTSAAQVMGSIYFNLVQVPCLLETPAGLTFRAAREGF